MKHLSKQHKKFAEKKRARKAIIGPIGSGKTVALVQYFSKHPELVPDLANLSRHSERAVRATASDWGVTLPDVGAFVPTDVWRHLHVFDHGTPTACAPKIEKILAGTNASVIVAGTDFQWLPYAGWLVGWGFDVTVLPAIDTPRTVHEHLPTNYYAMLPYSAKQTLWSAATTKKRGPARTRP